MSACVFTDVEVHMVGGGYECACVGGPKVETGYLLMITFYLTH